MGLDSDPFDDIFDDKSVKNSTRTGSKFQPKAKRGPTKKALTVRASTSTQLVETGDSVKNVDSVALETENPSGPYDKKCLESVTLSEYVANKESAGHTVDDERCSETVNPLEHAANKESVDHTVSSLPESDVLITEWSSCVEKSVRESADIFLGLDSPEGFHPHSTTAMESSIPSSETLAIPNQNEEDGLASFMSHVTDLECISNNADDLTRPELSPAQDPLTRGQCIVSIDEGDCHLHDGRPESEQMESYPSLESLDMSHATIISGARTGKFQPKPKIQVRKEITEARTVKPNGGETSISQMNEHLDPSEMDYVANGSVSAFPPDGVLDLSSLGLDHTTTEPISEIQADEQPRHLTEASRAKITSREETVSEMLKKIVTRRAKVGKSRNISVQNVSGRKHANGHELVDEEPNVEFLAGCPGGSVMNEDHGDDLLVENEPQAKKKRRKSKKTVGEQGKPVRKGDEAPDQAIAVKPKKFSHSTRQRRRRVNKVLLDTPEDEIIYETVPLRDLIILADYKERKAKREAVPSEANLDVQSGGTSSIYRNEDEEFDFEQGEEADDEQANPNIQKDSGYFNYQTFMDKTPVKRWSKQETELFYEAMQQFGTDLSMIQQLFPGRTRRQIKLKFKKEERQYPLRLREALTNRANDHCHFEKVIEHLRQMAAENKQNDQDESMDLADDEEAEEIPAANDEAAKSEQQTEQGKVEGLEPDISAQSPPILYESEEEVINFSEYKSEI